MNNKILITGASGLLGSRLFPFLKINNFNVFSQAKNNNADYQFDLTNSNDVTKSLNVLRPDIIVNLVAETNVDLCESDPNLSMVMNIRTVENLASWIKNYHHGCFLIHISTDHLYDESGLNSEENVVIRNNYALSKYAGEIAASSVSSAILRTNFFGKSANSHRKSFTDWIYNSLNNNQSISAYEDIYFSPLSISELINLIVVIINKKPQGIFNLGSRGSMSKADFIFRFANLVNLEIKNIRRVRYFDQSSLVMRPSNMVMDCQKFEKMMNITLPQLENLLKSVAAEYL